MAYAYAYACLQVEALSIRHADRRARAAARAGRDEYDHNVVLAGGIHAHAVHACILAHTRTYLRACERACMRACMHASLRACLHLYHLIYMRYIYIYIYIYICIYAVHAYMHIHIQCMPTCIGGSPRLAMRQWSARIQPACHHTSISKADWHELRTLDQCAARAIETAASNLASRLMTAATLPIGAAAPPVGLPQRSPSPPAASTAPHAAPVPPRSADLSLMDGIVGAPCELSPSAPS